MSTRTAVPAGAALERYARSEVVDVEGVPCRIHVALWEGNYSQGYKSDYDRIPTRWLVIEVRDEGSGRISRYAPQYKGDRGEPRRRCQSFTGKRYAKALSAFELIVKRDRLEEPGAGDARRFYILTHHAA